MYGASDEKISEFTDLSIEVTVDNHPEHNSIQKLEHSNVVLLYNLRKGTMKDFLLGEFNNHDKTKEMVI